MTDGTRNVSDTIRRLLSGPELLRCLAPSDRELSFLGAMLADVPNTYTLLAPVPGSGSSASASAAAGGVPLDASAASAVSEQDRRRALASVLRSVFLFLLACVTLYVAADLLAQIAFQLFLRYVYRIRIHTI